MNFTDRELYEIDIALNIFSMNISNTIFKISSKKELKNKLLDAEKRYKELDSLITKIRDEMKNRGMNLDY